MNKKALIIGAGPAGLTAAYELLKNSKIKPIIFEQSQEIGGISKTVCYKGNRIDIGGHRFFSKSEWVMQWWQNILPRQGAPASDDKILNRSVPLSNKKNSPDPNQTDKVILMRNRLSRILFMQNFFDYPISLSLKTIKGLGFFRMAKIAVSYIQAKAFSIKEENSLEDFFINRFGKELYLTFFKDYTEKVWGISCDQIEASWGAQRIKGLSITKAILHAMKRKKKNADIKQEGIETSLIEKFLYPKFGPGQLWEEVASSIKSLGGEIHLGAKVVAVKTEKNRIDKITVKYEDNSIEEFKGEYVISTMPVKELIASMNDVPAKIQAISKGLIYRDFLTVGLLLERLKISNKTDIPTVNNIIPDTWIYIQEPDVDVGRLQIFNNWSPYLVNNQDKIWLGTEYFCNKGDNLWDMNNDHMAKHAINELEKIGIIDSSDVIDSVTIKVPKAYPAYFGTYNKFNVIVTYVNQFQNLFLIGRNGMHRYNNMDHSMLAAKKAIENIINNVKTKDNIWSVNAENEYNERK